MGVKKIKISALPLADTLVGLYTIGVNALNKSVKVSLEFLKTAADKANDAATAANKAKTAAETATQEANTATENANIATEAANTAAQNATNKAELANDAASLANEAAENINSIVEAALRSSKEYTDSREGVMRANWSEDDASTLAVAKSYAEQVVAALVDGSPEALNTLQELAEALGNDPNFATTVMNEIGKRATTEAMNAALERKANINGDPSVIFFASQLVVGTHAAATLFNDSVFLGEVVVPTIIQSRDNPIFRIGENNYYEAWHSGNFNPSSKAESASLGSTDLNTLTTPGLYMVDGTITNAPPDNVANYRILVMGKPGRLTQVASSWYSDRIFFRITKDQTIGPWLEFYHTGIGVISKCCGRVNSAGSLVEGYGCSSVSKLSTGKYRIYHSMGHSSYAISAILYDENHNFTYTIHHGEVSSSYFDIYIRLNDGTYKDSSFSFITMPCR